MINFTGHHTTDNTGRAQALGSPVHGLHGRRSTRSKAGPSALPLTKRPPGPSLNRPLPSSPHHQGPSMEELPSQQANCPVPTPTVRLGPSALELFHWPPGHQNRQGNVTTCPCRWAVSLWCGTGPRTSSLAQDWRRPSVNVCALGLVGANCSICQSADDCDRETPNYHLQRRSEPHPVRRVKGSRLSLGGEADAKPLPILATIEKGGNPLGHLNLNRLRGPP